ncbi:MAG TPA: DUF4845 domain-containing protein [Terriglobales bacterium]|nr:DUF4845 domain-containing protein [Terriglobales bacterium]
MSTVKLLVGIGAIIAVIVIGIQVLPPYMKNYQFQDALNNEALAATYSTKTEDEIRDIAYKAAKENDIPIKPEQIKVTRSGGMGTGNLVIEANYTVHVDLPGYPLDLNFQATSKNKGIY